jgi:hypothetical protein
MTTLAILQPGYLPWLGFFRQMIDADIFVYYDDVQFDKHGWRNRNRVKGPAGPVWLSVPVRHTGRADQTVNDAEIVAGTPWAKKQVRTIRQLYARAAHLEPYAGEFEELLGRPWQRLVDLDIALVERMRDWFKITTPLHRSSKLGVGGGKVERLVDICRHFGATRYLSGNAAKSYLDPALFDAAGIELRWQDYAHPVYPQLHGDFTSHLSALDLVLNTGPAAADILRGSGAGIDPLRDSEME